MIGSVIVEKTVKRERQSNFELLRIVSMLMIIAHHFSYHGGFSFAPQELSVNAVWINSLLPIGKIGVDIFVLISGYFLSKSSKLTVKKIAKFWGQLLFYSAFIYIIFVLIQKEEWSVKALLSSFIPRWFASTYFYMFLLSPLLNKIIDSITQRQHIIVLLGGFVLWCVIPTLLAQVCGSNKLLWFIYLYFVSAYIRKYADNINLSSLKCLIAAVFFWLVSFLLELVFPQIFIVFPKYFSHDMNTVFVFLSSVFLFLAFKNFKTGCIKAVNVIASATFGVYLIHDNDLVRNVLWNDIFRNTAYQNSRILIPYTIFAVVCIFVVSSVIELVRIYTVEKGFIKLIDIAEPTITKAADFLLNCVIKFTKKCALLLEKKNKTIKNIDK